MEKIKLQRAKSPSEILSTKFKVLDFGGVWQQHLGCPERKGCWTIWGNSGEGKSHYAIQMAKYLCNFGKVLFNSIEEGIGQTIQDKMVLYDMLSVDGKFNGVEDECYEHLEFRLKKHKSAHFVFIDSIQVFRHENGEIVEFSDLRNLIRSFPGKLFVFVSQAENNKPIGIIGSKVVLEANIKINVRNYIANLHGNRYGSYETYDIYPEKHMNEL